MSDPRPYLESKQVRKSLIAFIVIVTLMALAGTVLGGFNSAQNSATIKKNTLFAECIANYNNLSQQNTQARAKLNGQALQVQQDQVTALGAVVLSVADAKTSATVVSALAHYKVVAKLLAEEEAHITKMKAEHPVPPPPSEVCKQ